MLAQVIGNLNGLPHEFKYINEPGNVEHYTPALPDGARTDDDTDIEWVYLREIARSRENFLPPDRIAALWKRHINRRIFCANRYARDLMDLGLEPPWTGNVAPQSLVRLQHLGPVHLRIVRPDGAGHAANGGPARASTTRTSRSTANRPRPRSSSPR